MDLLSEEDWTATDENLVDTSYVKTLWNCYDESALEMMLRLSDQSEGSSVHLGAVTIGEQLCENYLKTLYALGFDSADRIKCQESTLFSPELIAQLITAYMRQSGGWDVLLMGRQSADGDNGKTPLIAAELLGWPCVTQVSGIAPVDERHLSVNHLTDGGVEKLVVSLPCVLTVGDAPSTYLRVPTLKDKMRRGKRSVTVIHAASLLKGIEPAKLQPSATLLKLEPVSLKRAGEVINGDTMQDKMRSLYFSYLKGRLDHC